MLRDNHAEYLRRETRCHRAYDTAANVDRAMLGQMTEALARAVAALLADEFGCESRGTIAVKGKGEVEAWYLIRARNHRLRAANDEAAEPTLIDRGHA